MTDENADGRRVTRVPEWVIEQLRVRFKPFAAPEDRKFNPSEMSTEELLELGLPPKPDADRQPLLRQLWDKAFGKPMTVVPFVFDEQKVKAIPYEMLSRLADEMPISKIPLRDQFQLVGRLYHRELGPAVHAGVGSLDRAGKRRSSAQ